MDSDKSSSLQRFCRVCMIICEMEDLTVELFTHKPSPDQPTIGAMLGIICSTVFSEEPGHYLYDPGMPLRACQRCERAIIDAYRLHQLCVETDQRLRELLVVKQEPLVHEEEITVDPVLDIELSECGVKVENGESMSDSECNTLKIRRTSPRKKLIAKTKPDRRNQKRVRASCEYCSEWFDSYIRLRKHLEQNHPDCVHRCEICKTIFLSEEKYEEHRQFHITGKRFGCQICGKRFKLHKSLDGHLTTHTKEDPSPCPECGKMFKHANSLRNHILRHSKQQTFYPCTQCPVKTASMAKMRDHMLTHTKEKNHVCESCGSRFTVAFSLQMHMKNVHGERNFTCKMCDLKFTSSKNLTRHMRTHTGEKPYKCAYCGRAYAQSNDLLKHSKTHVGANPYACDRCDAAFRFVTELRNHYKVHFSDTDNAEADATGAMSGGIGNKAMFTIAEILKRRFEAEQQRMLAE